MTQTVTLHPFQNEQFQGEIWSGLAITAEIQRTNDGIELIYRLHGELSNLICPSPVSTPSRKDNLWETTCFEFFVSPQQSLDYYEVNLSPSGHWNVYHFDGYRTGMTTVSAIQTLPYQTQQSASELILNCHFPLTPIHLESHPLELSITTVLQHQSNAISYWATRHTSDQADFHPRHSFVIHI